MSTAITNFAFFYPTIKLSNIQNNNHAGPSKVGSMNAAQSKCVRVGSSQGAVRGFKTMKS